MFKHYSDLFNNTYTHSYRILLSDSIGVYTYDKEHTLTKVPFYLQTLKVDSALPLRIQKRNSYIHFFIPTLFVIITYLKNIKYELLRIQRISNSR